MAIPVTFEGANLLLMPPEGRGDVAPMHAFNNGQMTVSRWLLTLDELDAVNRTGCVWLAVAMGKTAPPVFVGSQDSVREVAADSGPIWKKEIEDDD